MRRIPPLGVSPAGGALAALVLEAAVGYPRALGASHPVTWIGGALDRLERRFNRPDRSEGRRRSAGVASLALVAGGAALAGLAVQGAIGRAPRRWRLPAYAAAASVGLAQRSLYDHVAPVARALERGDIEGARVAVGRIVGRDTDRLDPSDVAAAALESLAESFNDGVVAPAFWLVLAGLPGLYLYKAVNTADSMIGHREPRWRAFGWASARTDDLLNLMPARIAGALLALAGAGGWRTMLRDAPAHASPNAGWPEAAMAGALRIRLGGPALYDGVDTSRPWFGRGRTAEAADLRAGLAVYLKACLLLWAGVAVGRVAWRRR